MLKKTSFAVGVTLFCLGSSAFFATQRAQAEESQVVHKGARFTVITPTLVRMEYDKREQFVESPSLFAVNRSTRFNFSKISRTGDMLEIFTGKLRLQYQPNDQPFNASNLKIWVLNESGSPSAWVPGQPNLGNLGGTIRTLDGVRGPVNLDQGVLSKDGWFVLDDSLGHLLENGWVKSRVIGAANPALPGSDLYFFGYGKDYRAALNSLVAISGKVPLPRKYALGSWYSRYWPYSSQDYRSIVAEYDQHGFPIDIMVMDMDWHKDGWTGYSWNRQLLPDAENLISWFHEQGLAVTLNDHPALGVGPQEDMYAEFMREMGEDSSTAKTIAYDAGNKKFMDTMFKVAQGARERDGVDFWWLDWQQYYYTKSIPDLSNITWLNHYYSAQSRKNGRRAMSFSRWGGWGDHRNPIHFSGDAHTNFKMLDFEVPMTSTAGNVGCFYWSHDIGGHWGGRNEESYVRWVQFGATSAALRIHSTRDATMDRRPWTYSHDAELSMKAAYELRSKLFPYIYTAAWISHDQNLPLNRPMYLMHSKTDSAFQNPQQYYFGDHLIVAPITTPGQGPEKVSHQTVWFPQGTWYNYLTGERFEGNKTQLVSATLQEFPVFAKAGVVIPTQPFQKRMATAKLDRLVLKAFPGELDQQSTSILYEDDGISEKYLSGDSVKTQFTYKRTVDRVAIEVSPGKGSFSGKVLKRSYVIDLPEMIATSELSAVMLASDGSERKLSTSYSADSRSVSIEIPAQSPEIGFEVKVSGISPSNGIVAAQIALDRRLKGLLGWEYVAGRSVTEYLTDYSRRSGVEALLSELAALDNLGGQVRSSGTYLFPEKKDLLRVFSGSSGVKYEVQDKACGNSVQLTQGNCTTSQAMCSVTLPMQMAIAGLGGEGSPVGCQKERTLKLATLGGSSSIQWVRKIDEIPSVLSSWSVVGPFPFDVALGASKQAYGPEKNGVDLGRTYLDGASGPVRWQPISGDSEGIYDLWPAFHSENRLAYAVTFLKSTQDQDVTFRVNSDDQVQVFLDSKVVHTNDVWRPITTDPDVVKVRVPRGNHTLLVKIANGGGGWAYKVGVEAALPLFQSSRPF